MQHVETVLISILSLLNNAEVLLPANANAGVMLRNKSNEYKGLVNKDLKLLKVAKTLRSMHSISINNNLLRHKQTACCKVQRLIVAYIRSKQRKMQYNYNPKTRLQNNNRYAKAIVYSARQSNTINNAP
ncbi:hypothetical protein HBH66_141170 [Parastagonospora nodorum]|nr:hypothetical protein HBH87_249360 [Parastagonospora nodorum]KAH4723603.1 hypothetical protein HBH66_141170 [Parastagonospora nodorum]